MSTPTVTEIAKSMQAEIPQAKSAPDETMQDIQAELRSFLWQEIPIPIQKPCTLYMIDPVTKTLVKIPALATELPNGGFSIPGYQPLSAFLGGN